MSSTSHVRFIVCKLLVSSLRQLPWKEPIMCGKIYQGRGPTGGGALIHRQGKMYSSNPLKANTVIFNLLHCRITVRAAVDDLYGGQGSPHAELGGVGPSVVKKTQWTEAAPTQPSSLLPCWGTASRPGSLVSGVLSSERCTQSWRPPCCLSIASASLDQAFWQIWLKNGRIYR